MKIGLVCELEKNENNQWCNSSNIYSNELSQVMDINDALIKNNYETITLGNFSVLKELVSKGMLNVDLIFYTVERCFNRNNNGSLAGYLHENKIPYVGNDAYVNTVTADKCLLKDISTLLGIPTPKYTVFNEDDTSSIRTKLNEKKLEFPLILKFRYGTMSFGTCIVNNIEQLSKKLYTMINEGKGDVLCEEYISGTEITVPIIGTGKKSKIISINELVDDKLMPLEIYSSYWKYEYDKFLIMRKLNSNSQTLTDISEYSQKIYNYLGCLDFARLDYRLSKNNIPYLLEVNSIPSFSYESSFDPVSYGGTETFVEVIGNIIKSTLERYKL